MSWSGYTDGRPLVPFGFAPSSCKYHPAKRRRCTFQQYCNIINLKNYIMLRVAEVGRLSSNAINAFNSFVGRVFANSRQKTLFSAYYQNCNKKVVFT